MQPSVTDSIQHFLADAISAITILSVDHKISLEGTHHLYIQTDDLTTIDIELMDQLVIKHATSELKYRYLIPAKIVRKEGHVKNEGVVCVYVEFTG